MPRDLVAEKKHQKELRRKPHRLFERMKKGGSGKYKNGAPGNDPLVPPGGKGRENAPPRGPKKFKWKRDVLKKGRA